MLSNNGLIAQSLYTMAARIIGIGLNFTLSILMARVLTLAKYGDMKMLLTVVTTVALLSRLGVEQLLVKKVASVAKEQIMYGGLFLKRSFIIVFVTSIICIALWILFSKPLTQVLFDHISITSTILVSFSVLFYNTLFLNAIYLRALQKTVLSTLVENALPATIFLILIGLFFQDFPEKQLSYRLYALSLLFAALLSILIVLPWARVKAKGTATPHLEVPNIPEIVKQSLPLAPVSFFAFLMLWSDTIMVGALLDSDEVGLYATAAQISFFSLLLLNALDSTIYPRLLNIDTNHPKQFITFFWKSTGLVIGSLLLTTLVLMLLSKPILSVFGAEFIAATSALLILLLAQWIRASSLTFSLLFIMRDKVRYLNLALTAALIVNLISNYILIHAYGYIGAAIGTLLANGFLTTVILVMFFRLKLLTPLSNN